MNSDLPIEDSPGIGATLQTAALAGLGAGVALAFVDLLVGTRTPHWLGWELHEYGRVAGGMALYGAAVSVAAMLVALPLAGLLRRGTSRRVAPFIAVFVVALGVWAGLAILTDRFTLLQEQLIGGIIALGVAVTALHATGSGKSSGAAGLAWIVATASGVCALVMGVRYFFSDTHALERAQSVAVAWFAIVAILGLAATLAARNRPGMQTFLLGLLLIAGMAGPTGFLVARYRAADATEPGGPSVLFITADTLRASYCSLYGGHVETPELEALAAEGVLFERSFSLSPWTMPSIGGLFSSKYPIGATPNVEITQTIEETVAFAELDHYWLDEDGQTLVSRMKQDGYVTGAFIGNPFVEKHTWLMKAFEQRVIPEFSDGTRGELVLERRGFFKPFPMLQDVLGRYDDRHLIERELDSTRMINQHAKEFLRHNRGKPFFLWLHYYDPHTPFDPPQRYREEEVYFEFFPPPVMIEKTGVKKVKWEQENMPLIRSLYEAEVRYLDWAIGDVRDTLEAMGRKDDTYVVFTADHGEELSEHTKLVAHGHTFYNELIWVPLIMTGPGIPSSVVSEPISAIDVMPTLAAYLGETPPKQWRGGDLRSRFEGNVVVERPAFAQSNSTFAFKEPKQAIVWGDYKLIYGMSSKRSELYNLKDDPGELKNLAAEDPDRVDAMQAALDAWSDTFPSTYARVADKAYMTEEEMQDSIEDLKSLGYLD